MKPSPTSPAATTLLDRDRIAWLEELVADLLDRDDTREAEIIVLRVRVRHDRIDSASTTLRSPGRLDQRPAGREYVRRREVHNIALGATRKNRRLYLLRRDNQDENRATIRMRMRRRGDYEGRA